MDDKSQPQKLSPYSLPSDACDKYFTPPDEPQIDMELTDEVLMEAYQKNNPTEDHAIGCQQVAQLAIQAKRAKIDKPGQVEAVISFFREHQTRECTAVGDPLDWVRLEFQMKKSEWDKFSKPTHLETLEQIGKVLRDAEVELPDPEGELQDD